MSMDPAIGDFVQADVLVEGTKILAVGPNLHVPGAGVIDAPGRIVMPGFVDTHHHQFETALRSFLADGLLFNDGKPHGAINYFEHILGKFAPVYRPLDVYINELFGALSQLDAGVTTVHDNLADSSLARALRRCHPGPRGFWTPLGLRVFRERGRHARQSVPGRRETHQVAVLLVGRPAGHDGVFRYRYRESLSSTGSM